MWPKNERLVLNFSGLTESEGQSALAFITQSLGKEIGFTDWEGNTVYGVIMTPSEPLVRDGRKSLSLGFEIEISHTVIVGDCTSSLTLGNDAIFNRNRGYNVESAIDFGLVLDYN
jgi:DNA helicase TIP49 (TBP-interacting protein)